MRMDWPSASAAVYRNIRSAAGFHDVMTLWRSLVMIASSEDSITASNLRLTAAASLRSLMSRAIFEAPITTPVSS